MTDLFSKFDPLIEQREALLETGVTDPFSLVMEKVISPTVAICNGSETILLGTYNYMGMTFDPDVIAAGKEALDEFGSGTTGSRVLNGTYQGHKECEEALKEFYAMDHAMVFSTGYQANLGIISTIAGKGDYVILDIDSHASIYDGCALGNAEIVPFRHNDVEALDKRLEALAAEGAASWSCSKASIRCSATSPRSRRWSRSPRQHGAMVLVDEAHSMGFIGEHGRGVAEEQGVIDDVDFIIGTFSKIGRHGRRLLRLEPSQVRDPAAGLPPLCLHRLAAAQRGRDRRDLDPQADARRRTSARICGRIRKRLHGGPASDLGFTLGTEEPQSAIIAVIMPDLETRRGDVGGAAGGRASTSTSPARRRPPPA